MEDMKSRTKRFTIECWKLCVQLPKSREYNNLVFQLLKSSSSVGANWRASQRPKSNIEEINVKRLWKEADELLRITVASINTAKNKQK